MMPKLQQMNLLKDKLPRLLASPLNVKSARLGRGLHAME